MHIIIVRKHMPEELKGIFTVAKPKQKLHSEEFLAENRWVYSTVKYKLEVSSSIFTWCTGPVYSQTKVCSLTHTHTHKSWKQSEHPGLFSDKEMLRENSLSNVNKQIGTRTKAHSDPCLASAAPL